MAASQHKLQKKRSCDEKNFDGTFFLKYKQLHLEDLEALVTRNTGINNTQRATQAKTTTLK